MAENRPAPFSPGTVRERLDYLLGVYDGVVYTQHLRDQSHHRHFDTFDIRRALENGAPSVDDWDEKYQDWKYRVAGTDMEGDPLTVVVVFVESPEIVRVVTAYG
jgi:hypothetical protein